MPFRFEWDAEKANENLAKHGVAFLEATTAFLDGFALVMPDAKHSTGEERFVLLGESSNGRLLVVVYTEPEGGIRVISARRAESHEGRDFRSRREP